MRYSTVAAGVAEREEGDPDAVGRQARISTDSITVIGAWHPTRAIVPETDGEQAVGTSVGGEETAGWA